MRSAHSSFGGFGTCTFAVPAPIVAAAGLVAIACGLVSLWILVSRWRSGAGLPINGVLAYAISIYLWILFVQIDPLWLLVVPALHSLQYLTVVWRYELNYERGKNGAHGPPDLSLVERIFGRRYVEGMALFVATALLLGYLGFWGVPMFLNSFVPYEKEAFGGTMFLFLFWIFINVHHYFLDNVMWRRENPDTKRYLFD